MDYTEVQKSSLWDFMSEDYSEISHSVPPTCMTEASYFKATSC